MEAQTTASARLEADRQFHHYIAAKLDNKVLLRLLTGLLEQATDLGPDSSRSILTMKKPGLRFLPNIVKLCKHWRCRDPKQARQAMRTI